MQRRCARFSVETEQERRALVGFVSKTDTAIRYDPSPDGIMRLVDVVAEGRRVRITGLVALIGLSRRKCVLYVSIRYSEICTDKIIARKRFNRRTIFISFCRSYCD